MQLPSKKSLGQNFLTNNGTLKKIIETAELSPNDHIVEIGPGHGILTGELAKNASNVTAIELDDRLIPELEDTFENQRNIDIRHQDALTFNPPKNGYKIVANIPYYITSPLINHFLREQPSNQRPQTLTLLVQKEVAQKICASTSLSVLAIQAQLFGIPKLVATIPPSHFNPAPKVDSAILHINCQPCPIPDNKLKAFFKLIHTGFAHKRKKLIRNLEPLAKPSLLKKAFKNLEINTNARAEELTIAQWQSLLAELEQ
jgi:16S rRNA (adenine1518-N6/adenine1519-N6)-dimethyltransferase